MDDEGLRPPLMGMQIPYHGNFLDARLQKRNNEGWRVEWRSRNRHCSCGLQRIDWSVSLWLVYLCMHCLAGK
jgi:hypothetical protein